MNYMPCTNTLEELIHIAAILNCDRIKKCTARCRALKIPNYSSKTELQARAGSPSRRYILWQYVHPGSPQVRFVLEGSCHYNITRPIHSMLITSICPYVNGARNPGICHRPPKTWVQRNSMPPPHMRICSSNRNKTKCPVSSPCNN